ncbi:hypothetical protein Q7P37_005494 [Cladosporium fusiforme]
MPSQSETRKNVRQAIESGNPKSLSDLLSGQSQDRKRDDLLAYALAFGCERGDHGAVRYLLAQLGADANRCSRLYNDKKDIPPLVLAITSCQDSLSSLESARDDGRSLSAIQEDVSSRLDIIKCLLEYHAHLQPQKSDQKTVLSYIEHRKVAEVVLESGSKSDFQQALDFQDDIEGNALLSALKFHPHSLVADFYINNGANLLAVDGQGRSALMYAVWKNHVHLVRRLVQHKDLVRIKDNLNRNIWHHVAMDEEQLWDKNMLDTLSLIHEDDASVNDLDSKKRTPLHSSATYGTVAVAKAILKRSTLSVNVGGQRGKTPLHFATTYGHTEMVKLLLEHNADVDTQCNGKLTPLHLACGCGTDDDETVELLLARDAAIESQSEEEMTPLHIAAAHGQLAVVKSLLAPPRKANINAECEGGWTPLHLASWGRHIHHLDPTIETLKGSKAEPPKVDYVAVVRTLLEAGAEVNRRSRASKTALHLAAESGHEEIVRLLLKQNHIKLALKDDQGNTPLLNAAKSDHGRSIVPLLAPWTQQSVDSLPPITKQVAQEFDANVFDFHEQDSRPHRYHVSVYDLLYAPYTKPGTVNEGDVSTRPEHSDGESFRWIHLPSTNIAWVHTLLTKHFIEGDCCDVEGFREFEESLSQLQYRGQKVHARHMRPTCSRLSRRPREQGSTQPPSNKLPPGPELGLKAPLRIDSIGLLSDDPSRPPSPKMFRRQTDLDQDRLRSEPKAVFKVGKVMQNRERQSRKYGSKSKIGSGPKGSGMAKSLSSSMVIKPTSDQNLVDASKAKICLFMPYLNLEKKRNVDSMHKHIYSDCPGAIPTETGLDQDRIDHRDKRLHRAHLSSDSNEHRLHIRRTLDQFRYKNVNTRARDDDQVVWRYQDRLLEDLPRPEVSKCRDEHDILVVDQLWMWVFGPQLIVTCFPQGWQHPRRKTPALLSSILEDLNPRSGRPVNNVHELAVRIVGHCLAACDRSAERHGKPNYLDMFDSSVGTAMDEEVNTFKRFKTESDRAAQRLDRSLTDNDDDRSRSKQDQSNQDILTEDPEEDVHFLNIRAETLLLLEVKDIQDELGILSQVLDDQENVIQAMSDTLKPLFANRSKADQQRIFEPGHDNDFTLQQQKAEINSMRSQVQAIHESVVNSLEHKQRHASAIQARFAAIEARDTKELAASTEKAGRIMMVFTIVTVIFLPLSFLAAFFAISLDELPHNSSDEQQLSLAFVMKYVVGVGLGTALAFVFVAWYWHKFFRWMKTHIFPRLPLAKVSIGIKDKNVVTKQSGNPSISLPSSPTPGFQLRPRRTQADLEKAENCSSSAWSKHD